MLKNYNISLISRSKKSEINIPAEREPCLTKYDQMQPNPAESDHMQTNLTESDQIQPKLTKFDQIRTKPTKSDPIRQSGYGRVASGKPCNVLVDFPQTSFFQNIQFRHIVCISFY